MLKFHVLLTTLASLRATAAASSYNYDVVDENSTSLADLGDATDFQLAAVGRRSGDLFVAGRDRLYRFDSELRLRQSVSVRPRCRLHRQYQQLVTPCQPHHDAIVFQLLPATFGADTGDCRAIIVLIL